MQAKYLKIAPILAVAAVLAVASVAYATGTGGQSGPDTFSKTNNGATVTDLTTGLVWTAQAAATNGTTTYTQPEAVAYCANLTLAGYSDWQLPKIYQLERLLIFGSTGVANVPPQITVPNPTGGYHEIWSATSGGTSNNQPAYWAISIPWINPVNHWPETDANPFDVLCVR